MYRQHLSIPTKLLDRNNINVRQILVRMKIDHVAALDGVHAGRAGLQAEKA